MDGKLQSRSTGAPHDISNTEPLRIGNGETGCLSGKVREVRLYRGAIDPARIAGLAARRPAGEGAALNGRA
ncbi:MAG: hypothetical protein HYR60_18655 [Acidobacteria bacterium]|nr:hypothetical protein [Acidobacteriota bacterium]